MERSWVLGFPREGRQGGPLGPQMVGGSAAPLTALRNSGAPGRDVGGSALLLRVPHSDPGKSARVPCKSDQHFIAMFNPRRTCYRQAPYNLHLSHEVLRLGRGGAGRDTGVCLGQVKHHLGLNTARIAQPLVNICKRSKPWKSGRCWSCMIWFQVCRPTVCFGRSGLPGF